MTTSTRVIFDFKFEEIDQVRRQPDVLKTPQTIVPLDCLDTTTTAVQPTCSTKVSKMPSKSPRRQKCLLPISLDFELQHVVAQENCASQAAELPLMTSQGRGSNNQ